MAGWDLPATPALAPGAGSLTTHLRKLEDAGYLVVRKEFRDLKPCRWFRLRRPAGLCRAPLQLEEGAESFVAYVAGRLAVAVRRG